MGPILAAGRNGCWPRAKLPTVPIARRYESPTMLHKICATADSMGHLKADTIYCSSNYKSSIDESERHSAPRNRQHDYSRPESSCEWRRVALLLLTAQSQLSNPSLLRTKGYINGEWVDASDDAKFPVINPATGAQLAEVPNMPCGQVTAAIVSCAVRLVQSVRH